MGRRKPYRFKLPFLPALRFRCARSFRERMVWQWELFEEFHLYEIDPQWCETAILAISDKSGSQWQVRLVVEWQTVNLMKMHMSGVTESRIEQAAGAFMILHMEERETEEIIELGSYDLCKLVRKRIKRYLAEYGIKVLGVRPAMFTRGPSLFISQAERLVD